MDRFIQKIYDIAPQVKEALDGSSGPVKGEELYDFMMELAVRLEEAEMMRHQLGFLLMHARATVAGPSRTRHFQEALERAQRFLQRYEADGQGEGSRKG